MNISKILRSSKGSSMVIFALSATAVFGLSAMVIDIGRVSIEKQKFQNAIDASTLAASHELPDTGAASQVANEYIELNGYDQSDIDITFLDSNTAMNIKGEKEVEYTFARIFGLESTTVEPQASARSIPGGVDSKTKELLEDTLGYVPDVFGYVLFSGSTSKELRLNGSSIYVGGDSHTNKNFRANGASITIEGVCEAVTTIRTNGANINIGERMEYAPYVEMPDFSETIRTQAQLDGNYYNGDMNFNGSNIDVEGHIYVDGDVDINGAGFDGSGFILATGDITFNGSNQNIDSDSIVGLYSKNGDIRFNGAGSVTEGIVYAPNGEIRYNGTNQVVNGRVIGDEVRVNGGLSIYGPPEDAGGAALYE